MCYRKHLRPVRRARRRAKAQQRALLALDLDGFVACTLHTVTGTLTVPIERAVGAHVADARREALRWAPPSPEDRGGAVAARRRGKRLPAGPRPPGARRGP